MEPEYLFKVTIAAVAIFVSISVLHGAPEDFSHRKQSFLPSRRVSRRAVPNDKEILREGTCRSCDKLLLRDSRIRRCGFGNATVSTILTYNGIDCEKEERITCIKVFDVSREDGNHATAWIKSGGVGHPYVKINITSFPGKGYLMAVEVYGANETHPNC